MEGLPKSISLRMDSNQNTHLTLTEPLSQQQLSTTVDQFLKKQQKALWVHLNQQNLKHISMLIEKHKFKIHHGLDNAVSLYIWLCPYYDMVPPYSMFNIACGAIIIKDNHILLVEEKTGSRKGQFGIPGGRADFGESLKNCAQRQLFQETGIKAKFSHIMYFRQLNKSLYGSSDIYFACMMEVNESDLNDIKLCTRQLQSYKWVPIQQYPQFIKTKSKGTQIYFAQYIYSLYKKGYDFNKRKPNRIKQFISDTYDKIPRTFIEHLLVQQDRQIVSTQPSK